MRKLITVIAACLISCSSMPADKKLHATYGVTIGAGTVTALNMINYPGNRPLAATAVVVAAGLGKELYDEYDYGGFDYKDLLATVIPGVAAAYGWNWALNYSVTTRGDVTKINYVEKF